MILFCFIIITCIILLCRVNGKQSPNKHVKDGQKGVSKSIFHKEDAKESSDISNPEEAAMISEAEMNSGNVS